MAGQRQPTNLLLLKGKKHFTKEELKQRRAAELSAPSDRIAPPAYLTRKQREKFIDIACDLLDIGIMSNLDCDALARYLQSEENYLSYDRMLRELLSKTSSIDTAIANCGWMEKLENLRNKAFVQCRQAASDLGLSISSRCKLAMPKPQKQQDSNAGFFGDETG